MIEQPPPRPRGDARKLDMVELRMGILLRELEAETHPTLRAALLYHMGSLYEHELGRIDEAVALYSQAGDADPGLVPATIARLRIAERTGSSDETKSLCAALASSSAEPPLRAAALTDLALKSQDWASLMRDAVACAVEPAVPALLLEWLARARGYDGALEDALRSQAESAGDPQLQSALWLDLALSEIDDGRIDAGLESLELACESNALAWSARSLQRRAAREHGRLEAWRDASIALAEMLEADPPADPLDISVPEDERPAMAAFFWQEAATLSALGLGDGRMAERCWSAARRLRPDDRELHLQALLVAEAANDADATVSAASWFTENAPDDPAFAAFSIRQAVSRLGDQTSLDLLRKAVRDHPESAYAQAALDVALISMGHDAERAERLRQRADSAPDAARSRLLWQAARLAAGGESPASDAQALYTEAADASDDAAVRVLRDALDIALERGDADGILARASDLLEHDLTSEERGRLCYLRYAVTQHIRRDELAARLILVDALGDRDCRAWAPHVARARAALSDDAVLLARAHETLADLSEGDAQVGHWCAAGRAHVRAGDWAHAEHALREALRGSTADQGIVRALEHVLREGGRPEEVVALHESRSREEPNQALGEHSLMLAGATAERNGDLDSARLAYEEAFRQSAGSPGAALALADLARRRQDSSGRLEAYARIADASLDGGVSELSAFLRADGLQGANGRSAEAAREYEKALEQPVTAVPAAVALLCTPRSLATDDQRAAAEEVLADAGASLNAHGKEFASAYAALQSAVGERGSSAGNAWLEIAAQAPTESLRSAASLQGLRDIHLSHGEQAEDELFMLAHDFDELADGQAEAAIAMDEVLGPGDDPELLVSVLEHRLHHSTDLSRGALDAAHCRALVEADRGEEAIALLSAAVDERPDDLAVWETLRTAARQAEQWPLVAQACERLAQFVDAGLRADLLEEAGSVRLDCLEQHQQAEDAFRGALDADPTREIAFRRLHDLLTAREDADGLEALISARLALGEAIQRPDLLYERARLLRGFSDRPGALEVLDELFGVEPEHAGALALAAEVHVSLEQWDEAVDCLRRLSRSDIPDEQRRVAHLGAADFLETRLGAKDAALEELRAVQALGLADAATWMRIGVLEEELGRPEAAADAYREVFSIDPGHAGAAVRLEALLDGDDRLSMAGAYEEAIWARIDDGGLDGEALEGLRRAASWRGDLAHLSAVMAAESVLRGNQDDDGPVDLTQVSMAALWDPDASTIVEEVMRRAGPSLSQERIRGKKVSRDAPIRAELERLSERFGSRFGSVATSESAASVAAYVGRDGELCWVVPERARAGLGAADRFAAGRIAWAFARGGGPLLDQSAEEAAGTLVAILRGARCRVRTGGPVLPATSVKLRRSVRKSVQEAAAEAELGPEALLAASQRLHRGADRAGLLASGDIRAGLAATCHGTPTLDAARTSARALDLLRFWMAPSSPLWGNDV